MILNIGQIETVAKEIRVNHGIVLTIIIIAL
jgi:hypothetical protein